MSNNYALCFNIIDFVVISSYIELPCLEEQQNYFNEKHIGNDHMLHLT